MSVITWATKHRVFTIDFLREKHSITVEWQKGILALEELFKVERVSNTDSRATIAVAPSHPIAVFYKGYARVVFVLRV